MSEKKTKRFDIETCPSLLSMQIYHMNISKPVILEGRFEPERRHQPLTQPRMPKPPKPPACTLHLNVRGMEVESGGPQGVELHSWCITGYVVHPNFDGKKFHGWIDFKKREGYVEIELD